jgi:hypothetical protein
MSCFWFDILKSVISGLSTGLILALIGWFVWKRQLHYSKKYDVYIKSIANISQIKQLIENLRRPIRQNSVEIVYNNNKELFERLAQNKYEFSIYFGNKYISDFDIYSTTMFKLLFDEHKLKTRSNIEQKEFLELNNNLYGENNPNDEINTKLRESFERIQKALKIKHKE